MNLPSLPPRLPAPTSAPSMMPTQSQVDISAPAPIKTAQDAFYSLAVDGDLGKLNQEQRVQYLTKVTESLGLNPMTRPFGLIKMDGGKVVLYALKEAATQLSRRDSVTVKLGEFIHVKERNILMVTATAMTPDGRSTDDLAAIPFGDKLAGDAAANAYMKLATKAKRRVILAHCGLGMLDESELETIRGVQPVESAPVQITQAKPAAIPTAPMTRNNDTEVAETAPAVQEDAFTAPAVESDSNAFDYNNNDDRQWVIEQVKSFFPKIKKSDALAIISTFAKATEKSAIVGCLNARMEVEKKRKAAGQPSLLVD